MKTSKGGLSKMAIVRWDPFRELTAVQDEFNRLLSRARGGEVAERQSWMPSVDVVETQEAIELRAEVAGIEPEDINLEVEDNVLTISCGRRFEQEVDEEKYYRIERRYGSFSRSLALSQSVDTDKIVARYENGILEVKVAKVEEAKPKRISVDVGGKSPRTVESSVAGTSIRVPLGHPGGPRRAAGT